MNPTLQLILLTVCLLVGPAVSQVIEPECPDQGVVFIPLPDCSKYIICANGDGIEMTCPEGLFFNPRNNECDYQTNVPECSGGTRPPIDSNSTTTTGPPPTTDSPSDPTILRECGDTFFGKSGAIEYRLGENYTQFERCAFILRLEESTGFIFTLESDGISGDSDIFNGALNIFTFSNTGLLDSVHMGPPNPLPQAFAAGELAVVVFRTERSIGTGFRLAFESAQDRPYSTNGNQTVFSSENGTLTFPYSPADSGMLSAFVISQDHHKVVPSNATLKLFINDIDFYLCGDPMLCGCDSIQIFDFRNTIAAPVRVCHPQYHQNNFITNGLYIVIVNIFADTFPRSVTFNWEVDTSIV